MAEYLTIEIEISFTKLRANNLIVLVKTNLCSLFLQNYFKMIPLLSGHQARSQGCPLNTGFTVYGLTKKFKLKKTFFFFQIAAMGLLAININLPNFIFIGVKMIVVDRNTLWTDDTFLVNYTLFTGIQSYLAVLKMHLRLQMDYWCLGFSWRYSSLSSPSFIHVHAFACVVVRVPHFPSVPALPPCPHTFPPVPALWLAEK